MHVVAVHEIVMELDDPFAARAPQVPVGGTVLSWAPAAVAPATTTPRARTTSAARRRIIR
jgi:hypothetical protein